MTTFVRIRVLAVTAVLALCSLTGVAVARADGPPAASVVVATPEEVVRSAVEAGGQVYVGDCADTVSPRDIGKVCSRLVAEQDGIRAYLTGRTFSEFSNWVFVALATGEGW